MRFLYFVGFLGLFASVLVNLGTLAGIDLINALLVIWPVMLVLQTALLFVGFYSQNSGWRAFVTPSWRSFDRKKMYEGLPPWSRYLVWAARAYTAIGVGSMLIYFATHGQVHGDQYFYAYLKSRPATPLEVRREDGWVLFGFSSVAVSVFVLPALHFLLRRPGDNAPKSTS